MENDYFTHAPRPTRGAKRLDASPPLKRERYLRGLRRPSRASRPAQNDPRCAVKLTAESG